MMNEDDVPRRILVETDPDGLRHLRPVVTGIGLRICAFTVWTSGTLGNYTSPREYTMCLWCMSRFIRIRA